VPAPCEKSDDLGPVNSNSPPGFYFPQFCLKKRRRPVWRYHLNLIIKKIGIQVFKLKNLNFYYFSSKKIYKKYFINIYNSISNNKTHFNHSKNLKLNHLKNSTTPIYFNTFYSISLKI